jgi:hypothetical protein
MLGDATMSQTHLEPDRGSAAGTPRWVKVFGIVVALVLLVVIVMVAAGGSHGPDRHLPSGGAGGPTPPLAHVALRP